MTQFGKTFIQDLNQDIKIRQCGTIVFNADNLSNVINVELYNGTTPATLGGTVVCAVICSDGSTVPVDNGTISGNTVTVTLTGACFAIGGQIGVGIQIVDGDVKTTVFKGIYNVERLTTENVIDPDSRITLQVADLIDDIETAIASIPSSYTDLMAAVAPTFDTSTAYTAGQYVWYDGNLYRFTTDHAAGSWNAAQVELAVVANDLVQDVSDLKSDLNAEKNGDYILSVIWEPGMIDNSGDDAESNTTIRTSGYIDLSKDFVTKIHTNSSVWVGWYWYDKDKNYLTRGSATFDGDYNLTVNTTASYVRFDAGTRDTSIVSIIKPTQVDNAIAKVDAVKEAHNQIANGICEFVCDWEFGLFDFSTGEEVVNNSYIRTDYINIQDYKIKGYYASVAPEINVIEYASDKSFIRRRFYNTTGTVDFAYDSNTVYIRIAHLAIKTNKILQDVPFIKQDDKQQIIDGLQINIANIRNLSEKCVHHDNFSRTETGYEIGKNSEGALTDNSYDTVTGVSSDDGVRVDNGLTIAADNTRTPTFTVRKINATHSKNFMVEFNAPESSQGMYIIYKLTDALNFEGINVDYNGTYYGCIQRTIANGAFRETIEKHNIYDATGYVVRLYFIGGIIAVFIDDRYCCSFYADSIDDYIYIGAYKGVTAQFDFINMFDLIVPLVYNTEYLTDNNVSALPESTISANADRYALDGDTTRFSNKSEHFELYSTDEKISNGRRTERSLVALIPGNLRTMRYEFDVLFPASILPDTATDSYGDIFFQLHDRQSGVSRGHVPFDLSLVGNEIHFSQYYASAQASETLIAVVAGVNLGTVTYDKWIHFDIFIKERYEEQQHPFIEIKINNETVYQSRKPNCANDVNGSSAQYGEYKNNWDLITYSERYIDNFKVTY